MKELSIEEKAKAYDEAIERAKSVDDYEWSSPRDIAEYIFPELSESEDERIRKGIIQYLEQFQFGEEHYQIDDDIVRNYIAWLEKQGEQKPADKVEPKFKVGDWIVYNDNIYHIGNIALQGYYECLRVDGTVHTFGLDIDSKSHLWTIADAKDGDVVVDKSDGTIGIFQSIGHHPDGGSYNDPSYCFLHCHCDDEFFYADFEDGNTIDSDSLVPATKEQRDLLFQKMKEAGYDWDADKKELKKISQEYQLTPDECIKSSWSEEEEKMLDEMYEFFDKHKIPSLKHGMNNYAKFIKSIKERIQPKQQEWSEEDKEIIETICKEGDLKPSERVWLKSLRPQSTWKPSDEQLDSLYDVLNPCDGFNREVLESLYVQLKKLREE